MPDPQTDESSTITASVTAMVEALAAKGTGWSAATRFADFTGEAGADAARAAIEAIGGERVPSAEYAVVFGPQPVADLLTALVVPACRADAFHSSSTPFLGRLGQPVAVEALSLYDEGARPGLAASRTITDEGLPTGRTDLIRGGVLVGSLANWYEAERLLHDPALSAKLGVAGPAAALALAARNGFRPSASGGRAFDMAPTVSATNVVVEGAEAVGRDELLRSVGHGLYVGRIWYTYAVNGLSTGDFTCTVVGDSFLIRDGRLAAPLRANTVRINDNIGRVLRSIAAIGKDPRATPVWGADEFVYAPEIAVAGVPVEAISQSMEDES